MPTALYDIIVPPLARGLRNLDAVLGKGEAYAEAEGFDPASLLEIRLAPDMYPLTGQVQRASDTAKFAVLRIGGLANVAFADDEMSFADLHARVSKTLDFIEAAPRGAIDGKEETEIVLKTPAAERRFRAVDYALGFVLPNFFFHVATAYGLLRHRGVPVGKLDYLGRD